jgi:hypothetical protein
MEAFLVPGVLAVLALLPPRRVGNGRVWALLGLGLLPMVTFVVRRRFFASWAPLVLALAGSGLAAPRWLNARGRDLAVALSCCLDLLLGWNGVMDQNRAAERLLGKYLAERLEPGQTVAGDMTRVLWFAGQRPLPTRHFEPDWFVQRAQEPSVHYVVLSIETRRESYPRIAEGIAAQFVPCALPPLLRDVAAERGIAVFVRR